MKNTDFMLRKIKGESTYNKYKRQRAELMKIVNIDIQQFVLNQRDIPKRIEYLKKYLIMYRVKQINDKEIKK